MPASHRRRTWMCELQPEGFGACGFTPGGALGAREPPSPVPLTLRWRTWKCETQHNAGLR